MDNIRIINYNISLWDDVSIEHDLESENIIREVIPSKKNYQSIKISGSLTLSKEFYDDNEEDPDDWSLNLQILYCLIFSLEHRNLIKNNIFACIADDLNKYTSSYNTTYERSTEDDKHIVVELIFLKNKYQLILSEISDDYYLYELNIELF